MFHPSDGSRRNGRIARAAVVSQYPGGSAMNGKKITGMLVATAAVGFLSSGFMMAAEAKDSKAEAKAVRCAGVNSCAGKGECSAADGSHECAGKNSCKGKGWVKVASEKACTDQKGTVVAEKKKA